MILLSFCGILLGAVLLVSAHFIVKQSASGKTFAQAADITDGDRVALVLGCAKTLQNGRNNRFFTTRMKAAAELYHAGKCRALIVSGDNHIEEYDEPTDMKDALIAAGVPEQRIFCDYAGFRTLDSVVRAREVFGQNRIVLVSQQFHNERAIYLAGRHGIDAVGVNASDVRFGSAVMTHVREVFARAKAVLDTTVLGTKPKFLGPPVEMVGR